MISIASISKITMTILKRNEYTSSPSIGGYISRRIQSNARPRLTFGQDEVIYRSSQVNESYWTVDGESTLQTKGLGTGIMVSASR